MKKSISHIALVIVIVMLVSMMTSAMAERRVVEIKTGKRGASLRSEPAGTKLGGIHADTYLDVVDQQSGWYFVYYNGQYGWVTSDPAIVSITRYQDDEDTLFDAKRNKAEQVLAMTTESSSEEPYDMGIPYIGNTVYRLNMMNMVVFWVQTQMKATGIWYQGEQWDVTGNLGDHTMSEIKSFMQSQGYRSHLGVVDQAVIDELANWLGNRIQPVYVGGFYDAMDSIMVGGSSGSMYQIVSNLRDMIPRLSTGARWVQCVLKGLGYYRSSIDGKYGEGTQDAVMAFQRDYGFQERDYVSLGVARAMLEQYYYHGGALNRLP